MGLSFVAAEWIGWPVIEGSRASFDYLGGQGSAVKETAREQKPSRRQNHFAKIISPRPP
jgi:hypothetical protein